MPESAIEKAARRLGTVALSPMTPVVAGSMASWTITLTVGSAGIDEGGTVKVAQRFASDGQDPQFTTPSAPAFSSMHVKSTDPLTKVKARFDRKGHDRPWSAITIIDVYDGSLSPGDTVTLILGDRSQGSPGIRAQSYQESHHEFRVFVDPTNSCLARPVPNCLTIQILPGEPIELVCIIPTQTTLNSPTPIHIKAQDKWGNPVAAPANTQLFYKGTGTAKIDNRTLTFQTPGTGRIVARSSNMHCASNPITVHSPFTIPKSLFNRYWGDLHAQSDATVGTGTEEEYFTFARDWAFLDFCSHQGNDFQVRVEDWKKLNDTVRQFHRDGHFVVFPGYEWSGTTAVGGDRNVWYFEEDMPIFRSSHWLVPHVPEDEQSPAETAPDLFSRLRKLPKEKVLLGSHVGGRFADLRKPECFDEEIGPLVELVSCWGVFEWMLWDAFDNHYVVGVVCNSDGHKGRPGAEGPGAGQFGIWGGLTCVLASDKTRAGIWEALKSRRCYGTTGARMDIDFTIDNQPMGSVLDNSALGGNPRLSTSVGGPTNRPHSLHAKVLATAPLESVEIFRGKEVVHSWKPAAFNNLGDSNRVRVSWKGSRIRGRGRRVNWDGKITLMGSMKISFATAHFDAPVDQITSKTDTGVTFKSQTTGDTDSIDLVLSNPNNAGDGIAGSQGTLTLESKVGTFSINLAELTSIAPAKTFPAGGLDMQVKFERYPATLTDLAAEISLELPPADPVAKHKTPYLVKVTQSDGHLAWTSPIYV